MVLAQRLRLDCLPSVWIPDAATRQQRRATTERTQLTQDRTALKNGIHAILHQRLLDAPDGDLFLPTNLAWLRALDLEPLGRSQLERLLRLYDQLQLEINQVGNSLAAHAHSSPPVKLLMTLPGVDFAVAETVLAALGDITRFPTPDRAAAYLGLVPSTRQSGNHCYHGSITKQGSENARWMMVQSAQQLGNNPRPLGVFLRRLAKRKNRNVAVVAKARKLVTIAWHMLKHNEPYIVTRFPPRPKLNWTGCASARPARGRRVETPRVNPDQPLTGRVNPRAPFHRSIRCSPVTRCLRWPN